MKVPASGEVSCVTQRLTLPVERLPKFVGRYESAVPVVRLGPINNRLQFGG